MKQIHVATSPLSNRIFAGTLLKCGYRITVENLDSLTKEEIRDINGEIK